MMNYKDGGAQKKDDSESAKQQDKALLEGGEDSNNIPADSQDVLINADDKPLKVDEVIGDEYDQDKIYIDLDKAEEQGRMKLIACTRLKRVPNWKLNHKTWLAAYSANALRPNDYAFIRFLMSFILSWIIFGVALSAFWKDMLGIVISMPFLYFGVCIVIGCSAIYQSRPLKSSEAISWAGINLAYLGIGLGYMGYVRMNPFNEPYFALVYILIVPMVQHSLVVILRLQQSDTKLGPVMKAFAVVALVFIVLIVIYSYICLSIATGVVLTVILVVSIYGVVQLFMYFQNGFVVAPLWKKINFVVCVGLVLIASLVSIFSDKVKSFEGVSLSTFTLLFLICVYSIFQFGLDLFQLTNRPIFFGVSLFPIYKYNPAIQDIETHYGAVFSWFSGLLLLTLWGLLSTFAVVPAWFGVVITIGLQQILILSIIHFINMSSTGIMVAIQKLTPQLCKSAWIQTKT